MVWNCNCDGIELAGNFVEHFAKIAITFCIRVQFERPLAETGVEVDVTQCNYVAQSRLRELPHQVPSAVADTYASKAYPVGGGSLLGGSLSGTENIGRRETAQHKARGGGTAGFKEVATRQ
jgi:hypothetical protein